MEKQQCRALKEQQNNMKKNVTVIGAGGHGKVVIDCMEQENKYHIEAVVDDNYKDRTIYDFEVAEKSNTSDYKGQSVIIAVGDCKIRKKIASDLKSEFVSTIHPSAVVSKYAKVGEGSQIFANAVLNPGAVLGNHVIINTGAIVEHDCKIGDFVHLSPNSCIGGGVTIGTCTHIGLGASIIQGITIGNNVIIGAGAVVVTDIPDNCTAVGIPAKPIKFHNPT
jgi:sugar O-acyltransferase (sialic acid O-acetyltransferase NeuD family)